MNSDQKRPQLTVGKNTIWCAACAVGRAHVYLDCLPKYMYPGHAFPWLNCVTIVVSDQSMIAKTEHGRSQPGSGGEFCSRRSSESLPDKSFRVDFAICALNTSGVWDSLLNKIWVHNKIASGRICRQSCVDLSAHALVVKGDGIVISTDCMSWRAVLGLLVPIDATLSGRCLPPRGLRGLLAAWNPNRNSHSPPFPLTCPWEGIVICLEQLLVDLVELSVLDVGGDEVCTTDKLLHLLHVVSGLLVAPQIMPAELP